MIRSLDSRTIVFLGVLLLTALVWLLRGIGLLTFLPGGVLHFLLLLAFGLFIVNGLIETR